MTKRQRFMHPSLALISAASLLAACSNSATPTPTTDPAPSSTASSAMMDDDAMEGDMMDGDDAMEGDMMDGDDAMEASSSSVDAMEGDMMDDDAMEGDIMDESAYTDGTYGAEGEYRSPAGEEMVAITVTLDDGIVTEATFKGEATAPKSVDFQNKFADGYQSKVIGFPIDEIDLDVVNGSSLTPMGFMDALEQIKADARA